MDPNQTQVNPAPQPVPVQPAEPVIQTSNVSQESAQVSEVPKGGSKKLILVLAFLLILVLVAVGVTTYYLTSNTNKSIENQTVENIVTPTLTLTPTPSEPEITSKDTTDASLEADVNTLDQNLNNLNSDVNSVDSSFADQQTNLN